MHVVRIDNVPIEVTATLELPDQWNQTSSLIRIVPSEDYEELHGLYWHGHDYYAEEVDENGDWYDFNVRNLHVDQVIDYAELGVWDNEESDGGLLSGIDLRSWATSFAMPILRSHRKKSLSKRRGTEDTMDMSQSELRDEGYDVTQRPYPWTFTPEAFREAQAAIVQYAQTHIRSAEIPIPSSRSEEPDWRVDGDSIQAESRFS